MTQLNLELSDTTYYWPNTQVKTGQFANMNDYLQSLINKEQQRQALQQEITKGVESGISSDSFSEIIRQAKTELKAT